MKLNKRWNNKKVFKLEEQGLPIREIAAEVGVVSTLVHRMLIDESYSQCVQIIHRFEKTSHSSKYEEEKVFLDILNRVMNSTEEKQRSNCSRSYFLGVDLKYEEFLSMEKTLGRCLRKLEW